MLEIPIRSEPNQSFNFYMDGFNWGVKLRSFGGFCLCDVSIDGQPLVSGIKCAPNQLVVPFSGAADGANFFFECLDNEYPFWEKFGSLHFLRYASAEEARALMI